MFKNLQNNEKFSDLSTLSLVFSYTREIEKVKKSTLVKKSGFTNSLRH